MRLYDENASSAFRPVTAKIQSSVNLDEDPNGNSPLVTPRDGESTTNDDALMEKVSRLTRGAAVL